MIPCPIPVRSGSEAIMIKQRCSAIAASRAGFSLLWPLAGLLCLALWLAPGPRHGQSQELLLAAAVAEDPATRAVEEAVDVRDESEQPADIRHENFPDSRVRFETNENDAPGSPDEPARQPEPYQSLAHDPSCRNEGRISSRSGDSPHARIGTPVPVIS